METITYKKNTQIYKNGEQMNELSLIVKGSVRQETKENTIVLEKGNIVGLAGCDACQYFANYYAHEDTVLYTFPYKKTDNLDEILTNEKDYGSVFILAALKQIKQFLGEYMQLLHLAKSMYTITIETNRKYKFLCSKYSIPEQIFSRIDFLAPIEKRHTIEKWKEDYYKQFSNFGLEELKGLFTTKELCIGTIFQTSVTAREVMAAMDELKDYLEVHKSLLMMPKKNDLFQLMFDLEIKTALIGKGRAEVAEAMEELGVFILESELYDAKEVRERIAEYRNYDFANVSDVTQESIEGDLMSAGAEDIGAGVANRLTNSLEHILRFAEETPEEMLKFRDDIAAYRDLSDPYSTDEEVRRLRKNISTAFYRVYKSCVKRVLTRGEKTKIIDMFLHFGYMDASVLGEETSARLEELLDHLFACRSDKVYTFFSWLESIYAGEHEPSISELDMDYAAFLKDSVKNGTMSAADAERNKDDSWMKVEYELDNIFRSLSKTISGKITTFCPVLSADDVISTPEKMLVIADRIKESIDAVRKIDYSLFYREVMFSDEEHGLSREYINKEILPDVILFPIAGSRGMMWQVTEGVRNNTSARIILPILSTTDVEDMIIENCGRFRWEMCRKVQGSRWNDISTPSLTSEYNDYIQYYKKNFDLSPEAKEKIASALLRARNNYREVFVKDYENWIKYEAKGSFRLNKVARGLLFTYCPFSAELREGIKDTPMFADLVRKYDIMTARKVKRLESLYQKYQKSGGEITEELQENMDFYKM